MKSMRVVCLQVNAGSDWRQNLKRIEKLLQKALRIRPQIIALPENFYWRGPSRQLQIISREATPAVLHFFKSFAAQNKIPILLGSVLQESDHEKKVFNTSILISQYGKTIASYQKIHLFDIDLKNVNVSESKHVARGNDVVLAKIHSIPAGLSICYDLRFPELFRKLAERGAKILFVPSNFTEKTGEAHWEILLRARAIENQAFVIAPAQSGVHPESGIRSFGNSMVIDPWGRILARARRSGEGMITADLDFVSQDKLRRSFPVLRHRIL